LSIKEAAATEAAAPAEPEGPKTMTLEEFKKQKTSSTKVDAAKLRQANEGTDQSKWANAVAIKRADEEEEEEGDEDFEVCRTRPWSPSALMCLLGPPQAAAQWPEAVPRCCLQLPRCLFERAPRWIPWRSWRPWYASVD
jgi:hypothetical protein